MPITTSYNRSAVVLLESKLTSRLGVHETAIVEVPQRIMDILKPAPEPPGLLIRRLVFTSRKMQCRIA